MSRGWPILHSDPKSAGGTTIWSTMRELLATFWNGDWQSGLSAGRDRASESSDAEGNWQADYDHVHG